MSLQSYKELLHRCFRCGYCKLPTGDTGFNCPSYNRYRRESYSPGGRLWLIRAVAEKVIEPSAHYADILFSCTMCGNCRVNCCLEFKDEILNMIRAARAELVNESILPRNVQKYLENIYSFNNPWKKSPKKRGDWAVGTGISHYENQDTYLYYVGDVGSYHPRVNAVSRAVGRLLLMAGVSFGILGPKEISDGNEARDMGETALFEYLREKNTAIFQKKKVRNLITCSPHEYHIMKNHYPDLSNSTSVIYYLELMNTILSQGLIRLSKMVSVKVTYHDSCFLGRWNNIYELPRKVLEQIPMVELVEMERNRENAFCCGGGNGNFFSDMLGGDKNSPGRVRVREAISCGAEVIAVSCPVCLIMLEDAVEAEGVADRIKVMDISEIIQWAVISKNLDQEIQEVRDTI